MPQSSRACFQRAYHLTPWVVAMKVSRWLPCSPATSCTLAVASRSPRTTPNSRQPQALNGSPSVPCSLCSAISSSKSLYGRARTRHPPANFRERKLPVGINQSFSHTGKIFSRLFAEEEKPPRWNQLPAWTRLSRTGRQAREHSWLTNWNRPNEEGRFTVKVCGRGSAPARSRIRVFSLRPDNKIACGPSGLGAILSPSLLCCTARREQSPAPTTAAYELALLRATTPSTVQSLP